MIASSMVKKLCVIALFNDESDVGKNGVVAGDIGRRLNDENC